MDITYGLSSSDHFLIDDLLDFSNDHDLLLSSPTTTTTTSSTSDSVLLDHFPQNPLPSATPSSAVAVAVNYNTNRTSTYADDLCLPNEDVAELEWLSNFVDESFSDFSMNDDLSLTSASKSTISAARNTSTSNFLQQPSSSSSSDLLPEKTKSKRLRVATSSDESNHYMIWNTNSSSSPPPEYESPVTCGKSRNSMIRKTMKEISSGIGIGTGIGPDRQYGSGRKCTHCESEKTPQWRTGPMGPKTLCNACGVRYKSGRLVPEYRPAASPTFVLTQHSNSHRKVMELRRQKEEEESMNNTNTNTGTGHLSHGTTTRQDHHHLLLPSDPHDYFHHHHFQVC